ncbi:General Transcription And Dna Repair Factor Iih Helicase Subunit Xpb [Manis pentadactyla]|nr:General Transcription And Dna Repair Factor Iih Helicase Subunit Xpb [Manis pentadactyla]
MDIHDFCSQDLAILLHRFLPLEKWLVNELVQANPINMSALKTERKLGADISLMYKNSKKSMAYFPEKKYQNHRGESLENFRNLVPSAQIQQQQEVRVSQSDLESRSLHWLIIAGMKGTLTLSTERLTALSVAHYTEGRRLGERRNRRESCSPGNLPEKASAAAAQTWPNSSGSKGNSWGSGGHRVHGNIVSTQPKELSGPCAAERLSCARPASPTCPEDTPGKSAEEGSADPRKVDLD